MQQLHLVGFTAELDGLIFSARRGSKSGGYVVELDDRLVELVREAMRLQTGDDILEDVVDEEEEEETAPQRGRRARRGARRGIPAPPASLLSPKEIQARLRAGRSVEEVATLAGVDEAWVLRFASPVLAEQAQVIERAQGIACRTSRKGTSSQPLGASVAWNLADKGLRLAPDEIEDGWSAYHVRDGEWLLRFRYVSRGREHVAQWELDTHAGDVIALNRLASELGYIQSGRRRRPPTLTEFLAPRPVRPVNAPEPVSASPPSPPSTRAVKKATGSAKKTAARKAPAKKSAARKAPARKSAARKAPAKATRKPAKATRKATKATRKAAKARPHPARVPSPPVPVPSSPVAARAFAPVTPPAAPEVPPDRPAREQFLAVPVPPATFAPAVRRPPPVEPTPADSNGSESVADAPVAPRPRQRPLVAVRRIDSRARSFGPPPAQRVVLPTPALPTPPAQPDESDDHDDDQGTVIIQAPRAGG